MGYVAVTEKKKRMTDAKNITMYITCPTREEKR
jgi:hypothetical protein